MKGLSLLECALTQKGGRGVPACFASNPLRFSSASSPDAIMASFAAQGASICRPRGKGDGMGKAKRHLTLLMLAALAAIPSAFAQTGTIRLSADLREAARRIFHARL